MTIAASRPIASAPAALDRELRRLCSLVRLRLYRRIAWARRDAGDELPWRDAWADAEALAAWERQDPRGIELAAAVRDLGAIHHERFDRVCTVFALDTRERDALLLCLAVAVDSTLAPVLAQSEGRAYPTEAAIAAVFEHGPRRACAADGALARWDLIEARDAGAGEPAAIAIDPSIRDWICRRARLDDLLLGRARVITPRPPLADWPVATLARTIADQLRDGARVRVRVVGPPGVGRRTFAAAVAHELGLGALAIDGDAVADGEWPRLFRRAHRQAFLDEIVPVWCGEAVTLRRWPEDIRPFPLQIVVGELGQGLGAVDGVVDYTITVPAPAIADRAALWRANGCAGWPLEDVDRLAATLRVVPGEIVAAMARRPGSVAVAADAVREAGRERLGDLARWIDCPFRADDLVVPAPVRDALEDFVYEARERNRFWEDAAARRLFPQGRGLFALFSGPPGTGKTMAAQVIAAELGLDLYRISLSSVVSKYVGETAKNLQRILARAEAMDVVLLFDEADALFGKRTEIRDAHDRYANTDTNHLLQAIEAFAGIAVLASNKKGNIDPAFLRRLRHVVEFPRPDGGQRRDLWGRLVQALAGADRAAALGRTLDALATDVELTGAQIKNCVLAAAFAARRDAAPVDTRHLIRGLERELIKDGRALSDRERARFHGG
jgi:AAA+ superfamily predicted ATPase